MAGAADIAFAGLVGGNAAIGEDVVGIEDCFGLLRCLFAFPMVA